MTNKDREKLFTRLVGQETKGAIYSHGYKMTHVARLIGRDQRNLSDWLNGKREISLGVLCAICDVIGADPQEIVERAYLRLEPNITIDEGQIITGSRVDESPPRGIDQR